MNSQQAVAAIQANINSYLSAQAINGGSWNVQGPDGREMEFKWDKDGEAVVEIAEDHDLGITVMVLTHAERELIQTHRHMKAGIGNGTTEVEDYDEYDIVTAAANEGFGIDYLRNGIKIYWKARQTPVVTTPDGTIMTDLPREVVDQITDPVGSNPKLRTMSDAEIEEHRKYITVAKPA